MSEENSQSQNGRSFTLIDAATLLAQISAPIALVVTVVFSWLSWNEARNASSIQLEMFRAQNAPRLELSKIALNYSDTGEEVLVFAKNVGGSDASSACLDAHVGLDASGTLLVDSCEMSGGFGVPVGTSSFVGAVPLADAPSRFADYDDFLLAQNGTRLVPEASIFVEVSYKDAFGNRYAVGGTFQGHVGELD